MADTFDHAPQPGRRPLTLAPAVLADPLHYSDERVLPLATARWALAHPGGTTPWQDIEEVRDDLFIDARVWIRAAVAAAIIPLR
ncbi:hypothetical protein NRF20_44305 [Streptomyces sp. R-74717]|uniref:hypothetical protein n=1 Tax=Streptomyces TaxID=1883 RepID=UPI0037B720D0